MFVSEDSLTDSVEGSRSRSPPQRDSSRAESLAATIAGLIEANVFSPNPEISVVPKTIQFNWPMATSCARCSSAKHPRLSSHHRRLCLVLLDRVPSSERDVPSPSNSLSMRAAIYALWSFRHLSNVPRAADRTAA